MLRFWSDIGISTLLAFVLYLIIEAPFAGLDLFIRPQKKLSNNCKTNTILDATKQIEIITDGPNEPEEQSN